MRKLILKWLFGTDDIEYYFELLQRDCDFLDQKIHLIEEHLNTLERAKEDLLICRKLIRICENHGINVDEEMKDVKLEN